MKWLAKKYVVSLLNDLLAANREKVDVVLATTTKWIDRLERVLAQLKRIKDRASDGNIDVDEADKTIDETIELVKSF